jgi:hypothetical protein
VSWASLSPVPPDRILLNYGAWAIGHEQLAQVDPVDLFVELPQVELGLGPPSKVWLEVWLGPIEYFDPLGIGGLILEREDVLFLVVGRHRLVSSIEEPLASCVLPLLLLHADIHHRFSSILGKPPTLGSGASAGLRSIREHHSVLRVPLAASGELLAGRLLELLDRLLDNHIRALTELALLYNQIVKPLIREGGRGAREALHAGDISGRELGGQVIRIQVDVLLLLLLD